MSSLRRFLAICLLSVISITLSHAQTTIFTTTLSGANEVPAVTTSGTGNASLTFNSGNSSWSLTGGFSNFTGNSTAAHIHNGAAGVSGGVTTGGTLTIASAGSTSGSLSGSGTFDSTQIAALFAGTLYVNVHSSFATGGEVRGQLSTVPEPATYAAWMGVAMLGLAAYRRRRLAA